ncbi:hypothetical protein [Amycolatopsis magusensis]|uniref:Uncharacterized protein n=1 Tax=Amycolatopsis magusensis TaxID=882444 RepID=A0ABS4Q5T8_9PSEU|nr:hypothetical protein [Amycolatopsis magusensis]MBP2187060.1 hypothetical protein [Amycolatopsis magusensis]MDI5979762.1 hypothetical protein [Amycolatopsis magusensis]
MNELASRLLAQHVRSATVVGSLVLVEVLGLIGYFFSWRAMWVSGGAALLVFLACAALRRAARQVDTILEDELDR